MNGTWFPKGHDEMHIEIVASGIEEGPEAGGANTKEMTK
jgi:hypothetical protein